MNFCTNCENLYYLKLADDSDNASLIYYCRKCGKEDYNLINNLDSMCVSKTHVTKQKADLSTLINKYTKLDPTLPRIKSISCPNPSCPCNLEDNVPNDIIYIRYDDSNIKFTYLCVHCDNVWRSPESK